MAPALDLDRLPAGLRTTVARALEDVDACEDAIDALEATAAHDRSPDVLLALALVSFHEAAELVLSQIEPAAERSLLLIDEAMERGGVPTEGVHRLRRLCEGSLERERARRARRAMYPGAAMERARRAWMRGDDALAAELAGAADRIAADRRRAG